MSHLEMIKIQDLAVKIEPIAVLRSPTTGIIWPKVCEPHHQGHSDHVISTNWSTAATNHKYANYKVFERISGVISAEFLAVLPGNPLQIFESIVSEYGERLNVTISGNYNTSTLEILIHGENLRTLLELEDKLNALITGDDQTTCEDRITSKFIGTESSQVMFGDNASPKMTFDGKQVKTPKRHVGETVKVDKQQKSSPIKITLQNEEIPTEVQQEIEVMSIDAQTGTGTINTYNAAEFIITEDAINPFTNLAPLNDDQHPDDIVKKLLPEQGNSKRKLIVPLVRWTKSKQTRFRQHQALTIKQTTGSKAHICTQCSYRTDSFRAFVSHSAIHKKNSRIIKCSQCDYTTASGRDISRHEATHSTESFTCHLCPYETHSESLFVTHRAVKHRIDKSGEKYFECPVCSHTCPRLRYKLFYTHLQTHPDLKHSDIMRDVETLIEKNKEMRHVCEVCGYQSRHRNEMARHRSTVHSDNRPCLCEDCGKSFKDEKNLKSHRMSHVKGRTNWAEMPFKFSCTKCSFCCKTSKGFKKHQKRHEERDLKIYKCPDCEFTSLSKIQLSKHTIIHCDDRFHCKSCSFQTHLLVTLKNHVKKKHRERKDPKDVKHYNCPSCDFTAIDRQSKMFLSHLETHPELKDSDIMRKFKAIRHKVSLRVKCNLCQFKAQTLAEITLHKKSKHAGIKPYLCDNCAARYKHRADLRKHCIMKHPDIYGLLPYTCNLCDKKCITEGQLKKHIRACHGQDANVFCDVCGAGFTNKIQCLKHMGVFHKIGIPCCHCDKMFSTRQGLGMHMRKTHVHISETQSDVTSEVNSTECDCLDLELLIPVVEVPPVEELQHT